MKFDKIIAVILIIFGLGILVIFDFPKQGRVYDCGMAEWHPDIPTDVRDACRKLRYEHWKQEQKDINERKNENRLYEGRSVIFRT
jgi:hypothetical protein